MPKYTRIYTRTGDDGTTGLFGGARVPKNTPRIAAYGTLDELSSAIGVARAALAPHRERAEKLDAWLAWVQDMLFNLGAELATPHEKRWEGMRTIRESDAAALERAIDEAQAALPALDAFILPGGSPPGAALHLARTLARRAERLLVTLAEHDAQAVSPHARRFVNRLSDALFVWARAINRELGVPEHRWNATSGPPS